MIRSRTGLARRNPYIEDMPLGEGDLRTAKAVLAALPATFPKKQITIKQAVDLLDAWARSLPGFQGVSFFKPGSIGYIFGSRLRFAVSGRLIGYAPGKTASLLDAANTVISWAAEKTGQSQLDLAAQGWLTAREVAKGFRASDRPNHVGHNMAGANLAGADLRKFNFRKANLSGADLTNAKLGSASFISADMRGATLTNASAYKTNFSKANLRFARMEGSFAFSDLSGANMSDAVIAGSSMSNSNLARANLSRSYLVGSYLMKSDLRGASLIEANASSVNFSDANLAGAHLGGSDLTDATFARANLSGAMLHRANLKNAGFTGADLSGANLSGALMSDTFLVQANLSNANLSGVDLSKAELLQANLSGAIRAPSDAPVPGWVVVKGRLSMPEANARDNPTKKDIADTWYHGGVVFSGKRRYDRDRNDPAYSGGNKLGPGVYFTNNREEAETYEHKGKGGVLYSTNIGASFRDLKPNAKASVRVAKAMLREAGEDDAEIFASNWGIAGGKRAAAAALGNYLRSSNIDMLLTLYHDLLRHDPDRYVSAMRRAGYDGMIGPGNDGASRHLVLWKPIDEMPLTTIRERKNPVTRKNPTIAKPGSQPKQVKNLSWLLRNASNTRVVHVAASNVGGMLGAKMVAEMNDGTLYSIEWASLAVCLGWLMRPSLRGVELIVNGTQMRAGDATHIAYTEQIAAKYAR